MACLICGKPTPKEGFCDNCYQKIQMLFPDDAWEMMDPEELRTALQTEAASETVPAGQPKPKAAPKKTSAKKVKKQRDSARKELIAGIVIAVLALLSMPLMLGEHVEYLRAANRQNVTAVLESYTWRWSESDEQYTIEATYRWSLDDSSGSYNDTQKSSRNPGSQFRPGYGTHKGSDNDPEEVRPLKSVTLQAYQRPDGSWKLVRNSSSRDRFTLIGGYLIVFLISGWMIVEGSKTLKALKTA